MFAQMMYAGLTRAALPLARLYLKKRAKKQPAYLEHWDERFGQCRYPAPRNDSPRLWLHAVSLGETVASRPLIEAFLESHPNAHILLTCMTPTGRDAGQKIALKWPGRIDQCYLPYDTPELMGKFLDETQPTLGVVMETEVWPNLMRQAQKRNIPVVLANARESEKSARQARRFISVMRPAFAAFSAVLAQSQEDAERLSTLGAGRVHVTGSMKFDLRADPKQVAQAQELKKRWSRPIILLASTRDTEEAMFCESISDCKSKALIVLVPRHPQRFDEVSELFADKKLSMVRKSLDENLSMVSADTRLVLGDTMGEMSFYCALADVCIMGGSFGNFGSQNLIEPAAAGAPVVLGPSTFNFAKIASDAVQMGAAIQVKDAAAGFATALGWLENGCLAERSRRAREFAASYTGATFKQMEVIEELWIKATQK